MSLYLLLQRFRTEVPLGIITTQQYRTTKEVFQSTVHWIKTDITVFMKFNEWMGCSEKSAYRILGILERCANEER